MRLAGPAARDVVTCPLCRIHPRPCPGVAVAQSRLGYEGWRAAVAGYNEQWPHDVDFVRGTTDVDDDLWVDLGGEAG